MQAKFGTASSLRNLATPDADGGKYPQAPLIDVGGILYGTTSGFGALGGGTVFSITTNGVENVLHSFGGQPDGSDPVGGSLFEVRGTLYGTTWIACAMCGEPVLKRRRRHCDACMPKALREHGLRAMEAARKALAVQTAAGNDPRRSAAVNRVRSEAISEGHRRNRSWAREHPSRRDEAWYKCEIASRLDAFSLKEIARATGLSLAACSRIRTGAMVPHPRHWEPLGRLIER